MFFVGTKYNACITKKGKLVSIIDCKHMKIFYSDHRTVTLPPGHRFPMPKYALLRQRVIEAGLVTDGDLRPSEPASEAQILRVHDEDYLARLIKGEMTDREMRRTGFPWSPDLVERARLSSGGTICASRAALSDGISANLAGGTHHAHPGHGEGFCVFNDVAIATRAVQADGQAKRVVILDLDVHQGDGTAAIFSADETVYTFSVHGEKNFPYRKEPGDLDIALADQCGDEVYLEAVDSGVQHALMMANADLAIFIAGADPFLGDRLGRIGITKEGLLQRDKIVFEHCRQAGIPVAVVLGGGYAKEVQDTVDIHFNTLQLAVQLQPDFLYRSGLVRS